MEDKSVKALTIKAGYRIACVEVVVKETGLKRLVLLPVDCENTCYNHLQSILDARLEPLINDGHYEIVEYWVNRISNLNPIIDDESASMAVYLKHTMKGRALNVELIRDVSIIEIEPV